MPERPSVTEPNRSAGRTTVDSPWESRTLEELAAARLAQEELFVVSTSLDVGEKWLETLRRTLSPDELERAARFRFDSHRRQFTIARGILRTILGGWLELPPAAVSFRYAEYGKPFIDGEIQFNMSDSGDRALYAISRGRVIGIDLERIRHLRDAAALAQRFFAKGESERVVRSAEIERAFFTCWTRKEAYIKARGEGLSMPLDSFEVSVDPEDEPRLISATLDPAETTRWRMEALDPLPGYIAAIVYEGPAPRMRKVSLRFD